MYPAVKSVKAAESHQLIIEFDSGECRIFDAKPLLSVGRFRELASEDALAKVRVAFDTAEWENGLDIDPEYLYQQSVAMPSR